MKTYTTRIVIATAVTFLSLPIIQTATGATTAFFYKPGPAGSYIAQGTQETIINGKEGWSLPIPAKTNTSSISIAMIEGGYDQWWFMNIEAPKGQLLTTGIIPASRWPLQDPSIGGFSWHGNGRGLNTSTSWLNVLEFEYDSISGTVVSLAVDAVQFEETWNSRDMNLNADKSAYVSYRYNSSVGINESPSAELLAQVPEPSSFMLAGLGFCFTFVRRRKSFQL